MKPSSQGQVIAGSRMKCPNQQTTFCLTRLHMTLQITLISLYNIASLFLS